MPGTQFSVSRTAHANNSSNYYVDERRSNYTEVVDLLKSMGIDLDNNRFLILQVSSTYMHASMQQPAPWWTAKGQQHWLPACMPEHAQQAVFSAVIQELSPADALFAG